LQHLQIYAGYRDSKAAAVKNWNKRIESNLFDAGVFWGGMMGEGKMKEQRS